MVVLVVGDSVGAGVAEVPPAARASSMVGVGKVLRASSIDVGVHLRVRMTVSVLAMALPAISAAAEVVAVVRAWSRSGHLM